MMLDWAGLCSCGLVRISNIGLVWTTPDRLNQYGQIQTNPHEHGPVQFNTIWYGNVDLHMMSTNVGLM
jgi:hypothetical protein